MPSCGSCGYSSGIVFYVNPNGQFSLTGSDGNGSGWMCGSCIKQRGGL